jgi:methionyl-tRNA formyltransferase
MMEKPRIVFFGTPEFAAIVLERMIGGGFTPVAVVCNPDRPVGRKKVITPPPVKLVAIKNRIEVFQPEKLNDVRDSLFALRSDIFIVAAYAKIIPQDILDIPQRGSIGVHPSLLPKYRGTSPIQFAILNGDSETGVSLFLMDEKADHGEIISKFQAQISNDETSETLGKKLAELSGNLLVETLPKFLAGGIVPKKQDEAQATYTKKLTTDDTFIPWEDIERAMYDGGTLAETIDRKIRAFFPEPGVWTLRQGLRLSSAECPQCKPLRDKKRMKILAAKVLDGKLKLFTVQYEGKKLAPYA